MQRSLYYVTFLEDGACVARCLDVEVASEGDTEAESVANLKEALELYFEGNLDGLLAVPIRSYEFGELAVTVG